MNIVAIAISVGIIGAGYFLWDKFYAKKNGEKIIIDYAELHKNVIIDHPQLYEGIMVESEDVLYVPKLHLERPCPPRSCIRATNGGVKKVSIIKLDIDRYAYRIPNLENEVYVKNKEKKIVKHKWELCDDVVEQDVKHWETNKIKELMERHKNKKEDFAKFIVPASIVLLFLLAIILNNQNVKMQEGMMEQSIKINENMDVYVLNLQKIAQKVTGETIMLDEVKHKQNKSDG